MSTTIVVVCSDFPALMDEKSKDWPLAKPLGLDRLGYFQRDMYPGRLLLPPMNVGVEFV